MSDRSLPWVRVAVLLGGLAALVVFVLGDALAAGSDRLPGIDAGIHYAWEVYTRSALGSGRLPHWNPYLFAGMPHLANTQMIVLYPPALLLRWLPPAPFLSWMFALHLWIAGAGTLFLARVAGLGWITAATAAIAVALGGGVAPWLQHGHFLIVLCVAWLPWALGFAIVSARRASVLPHPGLVVVLVLQFLAGYVQGSLYIAAVVGSYFLYSAVWIEHDAPGAARWRPLAQLAVVFLLTFGLTAFQLLPFAQLVAEAGRTAGVPYAFAAEDAWSFRDLATLFYPFHGIDATPVYRHMPDRAYVGWLLACAAPFAFFDRGRRRVVVLCALLALIAIGLAFGENLPLYSLHHWLFPGLRAPGRLLFVATLALAVLGAVGLETFVALAGQRQWKRIAAPAVITVAALSAASATSLAGGTSAVPPAHGWPWLLVACIVTAACMTWLSALGRSRAALVVALVMVALDVAVYSKGAVDTVPVESVDTLRSWLKQPDPGRAWSMCEHRVSAVELLVNRQPAIRGLGGVYLRSYAEWLELIDVAERPSDRLGAASVRRDLLDASNMSSVIACEPLDGPSLTPVSNVDSIRVYRDDAAWPRAFWTCDAQELSRADITAQLRSGRYEAERRLVYRPVVNVRWSAEVSDDRRRDYESRYQLFDGSQRDGTTWRYVLNDASAANVLALLRNPDVTDTHGIDRSAGHLIEPSGPNSASSGGELLIGAGECDGRGDVKLLTADQPDGHVAVDVDASTAGFVFLSEPNYSERQAFVDGEAVATRTANLAFTAGPVPAGRHRVELRFVPRSFHLGLVVSGVTLVVWLGLLLKS